MNTLRHLRTSTVLTALVLLTATAAFRPSPTTSAEAGEGDRYELGIEGMSCEVNCAPKVKASLESIEGVQSVEVSFEDKRAIVTVVPGTTLTREICDKSFGNAGYFVSSIARAGVH